jgi:hypothetical protein
MREPVTDIPGLIINKISGSGRIVFLPADIDRQFGRYNLPDHGNLLANIIRWGANDDIPVDVECAGLIDCNIYRQEGNIILHLVNLTSAGTWRQPTDEYIPVGPANIKIRLPEGVQGKKLQLLVGKKTLPITTENGWAMFTVNSISDHEVAVIS